MEFTGMDRDFSSAAMGPPAGAGPSASGFDSEDRAKAQSNLGVDALPGLAKTRRSIGAAVRHA